MEGGTAPQIPNSQGPEWTGQGWENSRLGREKLRLQPRVSSLKAPSHWPSPWELLSAHKDSAMLGILSPETARPG